jgi:hypothetical protein
MPWVIFARAPPPDAIVWPGRRAVALVDAVAWPAAWASFVLGTTVPLGLLGDCALAYRGIAAVQRAYLAVRQNHRYHFTTWRWGLRLVLVLALGYALKLAVWLSA